jgi:hypothetical protein
MMRLIIFSIIASLTHVVFAQDANRFKNFHGIRNTQNNVDYFEAEGYQIIIQTLEYGVDEKGISKIKKRYSIKDGALKTDSVTNLKVLTQTLHDNGVTAYGTYYLIPKTEKRTTIVGFIRPKSRDIRLERDFVKSYMSNKIPSFIYTRMEIDSINFVGRMIKLGPICRWMGPHNVQCPDYGQMNWAIFDNLSQAEEYRETHFQMVKGKGLTDIKEEKWMTLKFEGQETKALRTKVKIQLPKFAMGGSNILIVYYVTGQVRGKYVTCILSHYTDDVGFANGKLPPLLSEVLELME